MTYVLPVRPTRKLASLAIIGASLSEPLLDELAGAFLWYIYIYIYYIYIIIFVSMGSPFGPAWAPVNALRAKVRPAE